MWKFWFFVYFDELQLSSSFTPEATIETDKNRKSVKKSTWGKKSGATTFTVTTHIKMAFC